MERLYTLKKIGSELNQAHFNARPKLNVFDDCLDLFTRMPDDSYVRSSAINARHSGRFVATKGECKNVPTAAACYVWLLQILLMDRPCS